MATVKLNNGTQMPVIGLGTWLSDKGKAGEAVKFALENGYKHIDCAHIYQNEAEIGEYMSEVWKAGKVKREDVYIVSKLWSSYQAKEDVVDACRVTLKNLQLEYLDLYLIHVPCQLDKSLGDTVPGADKKGLIGYTAERMRETWEAMEKLVEMGLVKSIGVSNFTTKKLKELMPYVKIKPVCNQVELHPYLPQPKLIDCCKEYGIVCAAYSPIGAPNRPEFFKENSHPILLEDDVVTSIAEKHKATPAQVALAWGIQRGTPVLPKSVTPSRIVENLQAGELHLDADDMSRISDVKPRARLVDQRWGVPMNCTIEDIWDGEYLC
ncbi:aldo-keto reductase family 1 member B10-like [Rhopilema esculentum]|uniref:aldo-keto reductase family 1 member B10-like n=1 Tax=Rhopilema esculentum TaxID=499914 RepID=UPI0031DDD1BD